MSLRSNCAPRDTYVLVMCARNNSNINYTQNDKHRLFVRAPDVVNRVEGERCEKPATERDPFLYINYVGTCFSQNEMTSEEDS